MANMVAAQALENHIDKNDVSDDEENKVIETVHR